MKSCPNLVSQERKIIDKCAPEFCQLFHCTRYESVNSSEFVDKIQL